MGELKDWAKSQSPWIVLEPESSVEGIYRGWQKGVGRYGDTIFYDIEIDGKVKRWDCKVGAIATAFDGIQVGTKVKIVRSAKNPNGKTQYAVQKL